MPDPVVITPPASATFTDPANDRAVIARIRNDAMGLIDAPGLGRSDRNKLAQIVAAAEARLRVLEGGA
jgi:hypothetical protein